MALPIAGHIQLLLREVKIPEPQGARIFSLILMNLSCSITASLFSLRARSVRSWRGQSYIRILVLIEFITVFLLSLSTTIIQIGYDPNKAIEACYALPFTCLTFYMSSKIFYLFMVDRAHIVRGLPKSRFRSKLYLFHSFGVMSIFLALFSLQLAFRFNKIDGVCIIGIQPAPLIPDIIFDISVNAYLTSLFLYYIFRSYSFSFSKIGQRIIGNDVVFDQTLSKVLHDLALRSFIGSIMTLASTGGNLLVLLILDGQSSWICMILCVGDATFASTVIYWMTCRNDDSRAASEISKLSGIRTPKTALVERPAAPGMWSMLFSGSLMASVSNPEHTVQDPNDNAYARSLGV